MIEDPQPNAQEKPLSGQCAHAWENTISRHAISQICKHCKLYRYKTALTADWEYRAPIPIARRD